MKKCNEKNDISNLIKQDYKVKYRVLLIYVCIMFIFQCYTIYGYKRIPEVKNIKITAHRGSSLRAPENTLSSIKYAIEEGADYAEIDVQETKDKQVVLFHDNTLKRLCGIDKHINEMNFYDLRKLDVGSVYSDKFKGEKIPTLDEVIKIANNKIKLNIEIKIVGHENGLVENIEKEIRKNNFENKCIVSSFDYDALIKIKKLNPHIKIGYITNSINNIFNYDVDFYSVKASKVKKKFVEKAHGMNKEVHVWTVNDEAEFNRLLYLNVDNIITDDSNKFIKNIGHVKIK